MSTSRVLVVDDSLTIRRALELILKPLGYELDFAADGGQALERATSFTPDLILLDYVLPDMRAPDVCAALAATPATAFTPIILVSAKGASIRQAYQDAQNVVSYITKPFKPQVVASVVENALARGRSASGAAPESSRAAVPRSAVHTRDADERPARGGEPSASVAPPASVEQAFAALLAQLEGAICEDAATRGTTRGAPLPGVSPRLRSAAERLNDVAQHLSGESVVPYRLRSDGSFANVAATLLEAHRYLCEAAILLAATGAPSAVLPRAPEVLVVCPERHVLAGEIAEAVRGRDLVPLAIGEDFAQLPHLVRLLAPRVVVGVLRVDEAADAAVHASLALDAPQTRFVALGGDPGGVDPRFAGRVDGVEGLLELLREVAHEAQREAGAAPDIDLEVVAI
ncbi:MAG: response regulator [Thermodesulfobacteriota bacterium]